MTSREREAAARRALTSEPQSVAQIVARVEPGDWGSEPEANVRHALDRLAERGEIARDKRPIEDTAGRPQAHGREAWHFWIPDRGTSERIATCPVVVDGEVCGEPLQATVAQYLSEVEVDAETGRVAAYEVWSGNDADGRSWDHQSTELYCAADHRFELPDGRCWQAPANARSALGPGAASMYSDPAPYDEDAPAAALDPDGPPIVLTIRHPDHGNEYVVEGEVQTLDVDLGSQFDGRPESREQWQEWGEHVLAEVADLPGGSTVRQAVESLVHDLEPEQG